MAIISSIFVFSCTRDNGEDDTTTTTPGPLFTAVRSVVQTNCAVAGCHTGASPQNGINFSNDNTIVSQKDRIKVRAVDEANTPNRMPPPPNPPLPVTERQKIIDWINAGGRITD